MREYLITDAKCLKLDLDIPHAQILEEAKNLRSWFVKYRDSETEYQHQGWHSLSLYGLAHNLPGAYDAYGYSDGESAGKDYIWTKAAELCPITYKWLTEVFPSNRFGRVRFMLLEAGGHISPHTDAPISHIEPVNIALHNPKECVWHWSDNTTLDFKNGDVYAMNIGIEHSVVNNSQEDRYHLIIHHHDSTDEWKTLLTNAMEKYAVNGTFVYSSFLY